jgi:hypothetical protein
MIYFLGVLGCGDVWVSIIIYIYKIVKTPCGGITGRVLIFEFSYQRSHFAALLKNAVQETLQFVPGLSRAETT